MSVRSKLAFAGVGAAAGAALAYRFLRPAALNWGATAEEIHGRLPGDELLPEPDLVATRAITVDAPPSAVWPWLVQMGPGRAGAYSYDWIERVLGIDIRSADSIVPEFQHLKVGDVIGGGRGGPVMRVESMDPEHMLVWRSEDRRWVWAFVLSEQDGRARLLSRNRISTSDASLGERLGMLVMEPGSLVMERKMLRGIKWRAEQLAAGGISGLPDRREPDAARV
jgi:hypothetical protein